MTDHFMSGLMRAIQRRTVLIERESLVDTRAKSLTPTSSASDAEQYKTTIIKAMINHIKSKGVIQYDHLYKGRTKNIQPVGTRATSGRLS